MSCAAFVRPFACFHLPDTYNSRLLHNTAAPLIIIIVRHRFERIIAGRCYLIEVTWVAEKRWRATIVRIPGVPTAMMPFYGETPDQAATNLSKWLDRAHQNQASAV